MHLSFQTEPTIAHSIEVTLDNVYHLSATNNGSPATPNEQWVLGGTITIGQKVIGVVCTYDTKEWIESYDLIYDDDFPVDFYNNYYSHN